MREQNNIRVTLTHQEHPHVQVPSLDKSPGLPQYLLHMKEFGSTAQDSANWEHPSPWGARSMTTESGGSFDGFMHWFPRRAKGGQSQQELREMRHFSNPRCMCLALCLRVTTCSRTGQPTAEPAQKLAEDITVNGGYCRVHWQHACQHPDCWARASL